MGTIQTAPGVLLFTIVCGSKKRKPQAFLPAALETKVVVLALVHRWCWWHSSHGVSGHPPMNAGRGIVPRLIAVLQRHSWVPRYFSQGACLPLPLSVSGCIYVLQVLKQEIMLTLDYVSGSCLLYHDLVVFLVRAIRK